MIHRERSKARELWVLSYRLGNMRPNSSHNMLLALFLFICFVKSVPRGIALTDMARLLWEDCQEFRSFGLENQLSVQSLMRGSKNLEVNLDSSAENESLTSEVSRESKYSIMDICGIFIELRMWGFWSLELMGQM